MNRSEVFACVAGMCAAGAALCHAAEPPARRVKLPLQGSTAARTAEAEPLRMSPAAASVVPAIPQRGRGDTAALHGAAIAVSAAPSRPVPPTPPVRTLPHPDAALSRTSFDAGASVGDRIPPALNHAASGNTGARLDSASATNGAPLQSPAAPPPPPPLPPARDASSRATSKSR